jgi:hypothetical protein
MGFDVVKLDIKQNNIFFCFTAEVSEVLSKTGDPCVGKTSFVQRYVNGTFHRNYKGTIGGRCPPCFILFYTYFQVDFALKIIKWDDESTVKVQMWDIAGRFFEDKFAKKNKLNFSMNF